MNNLLYPTTATAGPILNIAVVAFPLGARKLRFLLGPGRTFYVPFWRTEKDRLFLQYILARSNTLLESVKLCARRGGALLDEAVIRKEEMEHRTRSATDSTEANQRSRNADRVHIGKSPRRLKNDLRYYTQEPNVEAVKDPSNAAEDRSRFSPQDFQALDGRQHHHIDIQTPRDAAGTQHSFHTNSVQGYYPANGNLNAPAPYWTHYYPGYEIYPVQAGVFPFLSSSFAPRPPQPSSFHFFTPSYQPQAQYQQPPPPRNKTLPNPTRLGTLSPSPQHLPLILPEPSQDYVLNASLPPFRLKKPTHKLLILDLNGTLLHRPRNATRERYADMRKASKHPILRPYLREFMMYIFEHFQVMFWSSAKPHNVEAMINAATTPEQRDKIIAVWDRSRFGLSADEYNAKSITIKDLEFVFQDRKMGGKKERWNASNTILLDDSVVKAAYQPYNHVCIPEFVPYSQEDGCGEGDEALREIASYLEELRYQGHVARFIKQHPFRMGDGWTAPFLAKLAS